MLKMVAGHPAVVCAQRPRLAFNGSTAKSLLSDRYQSNKHIHRVLAQHIVELLQASSLMAFGSVGQDPVPHEEDTIRYPHQPREIQALSNSVKRIHFPVHVDYLKAHGRFQGIIVPNP